MKRVWLSLLAVFACLLLALSWMVVPEFVDSLKSYVNKPASTSPADIERGEYLARIGNCAGCHTAKGGEPYAGGRPIETPFGVVYSTNITPDRATGIQWLGSVSFEVAMRQGRSKEGRLLSPAFPYAYFTLITSEDSNALYAYLMNRVQPVVQANKENELRFPFNTQLAVAVWRALNFKRGEFQPEPTQSADWNRGAYLVQGLAHCGACHSTRNALGAPVAGHAYDGAMMPGNDWYAPSLTAASEASVADWSFAEISAWLKDGATPKASALGPMAEVIFQSTQYANNADLLAMATYLKALPSVEPSRSSSAPTKLITRGNTEGAGAKLYGKHCANCHGENGEGKADAFPPLAGNRAVTMANATNVISIIIKGGFAPATSGNPRPHGMPPYYHLLSDADIAQLATHIRSSWGNAASAVTELDLVKYRNGLRGP